MRAHPDPQVHTRRERGQIEVDGELVRYEILVVDAGPPETDSGSAQARTDGPVPPGNLIVVVPGHGQTVTGPRRLVTEFATLSRTKIAWCVDPTPTVGGDCTEARAIAQIVRDRLSRIENLADSPTPWRQRAPTPHPSNPPVTQATIVGWSHGGGEALRAAREAPDLFPQYFGLCPAGLVEREPAELMGSFLLEATRIVAGDLARGRWSNVGETLRVGADLARGLVADLARSRSLRCLVNDVRWACRKVPGPEFDYPGEVILLLGMADSVIRWRDAFPGCETADDLAACAPAFLRECFPHSRRVEVHLVDGNHMGPELYPTRFARRALALVDQLAQE